MKVIPISIVIFARKITNQSAELWMQKRQEDGPLNGLWEFPGGKIEAGEDSVLCASREVSEEVGLEVDPADIRLFKIYKHDYADRSVTLFSHLVIKEHHANESGWKLISFKAPLESIDDKVPEANKRIIEDICKYLLEIKTDGTLESLWAI